MFARTRTLIALAATALLAAGCGGGSTDSDGASSDGKADSGAGAAKLVHVDGAIKVDGETLTVTPTNGSEPHSFSLGPEIQKGELMALASSGAPARVTYRDGEDVAAAVTAAPEAGQGVDAYEGTVVSVDAKTLVIKGADGERSFDISAAEPGAFDAEHLADHQAGAEPIRVYFRSDAPKVGVAYEDA